MKIMPQSIFQFHVPELEFECGYKLDLYMQHIYSKTKKKDKAFSPFPANCSYQDSISHGMPACLSG